MNKDSFFKIVIVVLLAINISTLLYLVFRKPFPPPPPPPPMENNMPPPHDMLSQQLQFTPAQQQQFDSLREQHKANMDSAQKKMRMLRTEMISSIAPQKTSKRSATEFADSIATQQKQMELLTYNFFESVRALCTDKQKETFDSIIGEVAMNIGPPGPPPDMHGNRPPLPSGPMQQNVPHNKVGPPERKDMPPPPGALYPPPPPHDGNHPPFQQGSRIPPPNGVNHPPLPQGAGKDSVLRNKTF